MQATLRLKLFAIVAVAALCLVVLTFAGSVAERDVDAHLATIREQYIPKIGLGDQLGASLERVGRGFQDAANAGDASFLDQAKQREDQLLEQLAAARGAISAPRLAEARSAIEDYYTAADAVTRKAIHGASGEAFVGELEAMQAKQKAAAKLLDDATRYDPRGLTDAFSAADEAQATGARWRFAISLGCIALVLALSLWIVRDMYRGIAALTEGLQRFGRGDLATAISTVRRDELGAVATSANQMAERLRLLGEDRDREAWIKAAQVGLSDELRGELSPEDVARRALDYLARYLGAPVGVLYFADPDDVLRPLATHGLAADRARTVPSFAVGDGLVGEAARTPEPRVVRAVVPHLVLHAGVLGDGAREPGELALVPLVFAGRVRGMLELGVAAWQPRDLALVVSVREAIGIAIDVARNRVALRDLLAETQRQAAELLAARQDLEEQARELARASTYKSQFLANMSHELRTPLNAILGFSELLYDGSVPADSPQHHEFLADIMTSGKHLLQLINDILDLSKIEAGRLEFQSELIGVRRAVDEVLGTLRTVATTARVTVAANVAPAIGDVRLDPVRFKQVLFNYLSNAIKFTPEGGRVTLDVSEEGPDKFRIAVTDTGIGIAPGDLDRLFGEFQQLAGDGKRRGGTGLGLALTKRLCEAQGGSVGVASEVGKGSTFHAILPRDARKSDTDSKIAQAAAAAVRAADASVASSPKDERGPRVLVVEDDPRDRGEIVAALEAAGYVVTIAANGSQALAALRDTTFDAITLDLLLPDMNGLDVLRRLRDGGAHHATPVIVLTVVAARDAVAGFAVDAVLAKPLEPDALLASLRRAGVAARGTVMIVDDDPTARRLMATTLGGLGYATRCEEDATTALTALTAQPADAIVLDLLMPGMSGFEFLDRLRRQPGPRVPVIVWTSKDLTLGETATLRASANAVVFKGERQGASVVAELASLLPRRARA